MQSRDLLRLLALPLVVAAACSDDTANPGPDAGSGSGSGTADLTLSAASGNIGPHLVNKDGKTLYFYVKDTAGSGASSCDATCLGNWPAYDVQSPTLGAGLAATDFARIPNGAAMQTTFKGRPLYTFKNDAAAGDTKGEGVGGIWFVARPYNVFFAENAAVTPVNGTAGGPFLTNGAGKTLYVFSTDTPSATAPVSSCLATGCYAAWPVWEKAATVTTVVVPSTLQAADFTAFSNPGPTGTTGQEKQQFVYKGYPLYFFAMDAAAGDAKGFGKKNWFTLGASLTPPPPVTP